MIIHGYTFFIKDKKITLSKDSGFTLKVLLYTPCLREMMAPLLPSCHVSDLQSRRDLYQTGVFLSPFFFELFLGVSTKDFVSGRLPLRTDNLLDTIFLEEPKVKTVYSFSFSIVLASMFV